MDIIVINENDEPLIAKEKFETHREGHLHRAFSVMLYRRKNNEIEILLQKRSASKYHSAGLWSNTCCSHPCWGEDIMDAAKRRLEEELNITDVTLEEIGKVRYNFDVGNNLIENELDYVLIGYYDSDVINPNPDEAEEVQWKALKDLNALDYDTYSLWFPLILELVKKHLQVQGS